MRISRLPGARASRSSATAAYGSSASLQEVQDGDEQQGDGAAEVEQPAHLGGGQDLLGPAQVGGDDVGVLVPGEDGAAVRDGHGVVVDVDDARLRRGGLGDLVDVAEGGDAGADVEELGDALVDGVPDGAAHECPVGLHDLGQSRHEFHGAASRLAVDLEIVGPPR